MDISGVITLALPQGPVSLQEQMAVISAENQKLRELQLHTKNHSLQELATAQVTDPGVLLLERYDCTTVSFTGSLPDDDSCLCCSPSSMPHIKLRWK